MSTLRFDAQAKVTAAPAGSAVGSTTISPMSHWVGLPAPRRWMAKITPALLAVDLLAVGAGIVVAYLGRFGPEPTVISGLAYTGFAVVLGVAWMLLLAAHDVYEPRILGAGAEEYKRVLKASFRCFATLAIGAYVLHQPIARGFVMAAFPLGTALLIGGRFMARQQIVRFRSEGRGVHRTLVIGSRSTVATLAEEFRRAPHAGYSVVGAVVTDPEATEEIPGVDVLGGLDDALTAARWWRADTVALTADTDITPDVVSHIAWQFEGSGVDIVVAPSLANVAGARIRVHPVAGLALLHLDEPTFSGPTRLIKATVDRLVSAIGITLLLPIFVIVAVLVRATTPGPVCFRQRRVGLAGRSFWVFKFRTMYEDAEARLGDLLDRNESDGLLFKIKDDPRITPVGRWLRRLSIDELPQLFNVLRGHMSLVGPRPLPVDDDDFQGDVRRRLLVKPGITGLWQVSGRSDLPWHEAVRLDLYYVDNWSPTLDALILLRTIRAVFRGARAGAY